MSEVSFTPTEWDRNYNPMFMRWFDVHVHGALPPRDPHERLNRVLLKPEASPYGHRLRQEKEAEDEAQESYAFAIPCFPILDVIRKFSSGGVLELGAGSGYWSYLLGKLDVDVVAVDRIVANNMYGFKKLWYQVTDRNANDAVADPVHANRTLLLCWPDDDWAARCLKLSSQSCLAYVGRPNCDGTGGGILKAELLENWEVAEEHPMPNWLWDNTRLVIYQKVIASSKMLI